MSSTERRVRPPRDRTQYARADARALRMLGRLPENQGTLAMLRQVEEASEPTLAEGSTAGYAERDQARHRARIRALRALAGLTEEHKRRFSALRDWQRVAVLWERCDAT